MGYFWLIRRSLSYSLFCSLVRVLSKRISIFATSLCNFIQTLNFVNFATVSRSCCQQNSSTVEIVDHKLFLVRLFCTPCLLRPGALCPSAPYPSVTPLHRRVTGPAGRRLPSISSERRAAIIAGLADVIAAPAAGL